MTLQESIELIRKRTKKSNDDPWIVAEMNSAQAWVWNRLYTAYPDIEVTFETTGTFAAETHTFGLAAELAASGGEFFGHKTFYILNSSQNKYVPVVFMDANDPRFLAREQEQAQVLQPCYASAVNFGEVRFAPALPSGTGWRSDWVGTPPALSLDTQTTTALPEPLHHAIVDKATAQMFVGIDDDRVEYWEAQSRDKILTGIHAAKFRQQQTPQATGKFPARRRIWSGAYNSD